MFLKAFFKKKKYKKGVSMADSGLMLAFIGVVAITVYRACGDELKEFYTHFADLEHFVQEYSMKESKST